MKDYTKLVSRTPPEGLWSWATEQNRSGDMLGSLDTFGLLYEKVFIPDITVDGMVGEQAGRKAPAVLCKCSACGGEFLTGYCRETTRRGVSYGFLLEESGGFSLALSGDSWLCPICGTPVLLRLKSSVRNNPYVGGPAFLCSESAHLSASLLPGEPGRRPLVLTGWRLQRYCTKGGSDAKVILPAEAYVFDEAGCWKLNGWRKAYSGSAGYFTQFLGRWTQPKFWRETWGESGAIYGLTAELLEESCLRNAKLLEYMGGGLQGHRKFPVPYLRLYQAHPHVENLVVQGATYLLDGLMEEQMRGVVWEKNVRGLMELEDIDWGEVRPSAMLGLTRDEFSRMRESAWCPELVRLYRACKEAGELLTDDDMTHAFQLGEVEELLEMVGQASIAKTARYLLRQIELEQESYLYDPEIDVYVDPEEFSNVSVISLADYWRIAGNMGWDLDDPAVRWPKNLAAAHDRAMNAEQTLIAKESARLFRRQFKRLSRYSFASDGILIRPCKTQKELTEEGAALIHCVGGYAKDVAQGNTAIFFIRRAEHPDEPWYTLELDEKKMRVVQNRGKKNCERTEKIRRFEALWLNWLRDGAKRDKAGNPILPESKTKGGTAA